MQPSEREDYLETILILGFSAPGGPTLAGIAKDRKKTLEQVRADLGILEKAGDLLVTDNNCVVLQPVGKAAGERVLKKHRILQCFLGEILGMDKNAASDEACVLEHSISDNAIRRLGDFIEGAEPGRNSIGSGTQTLLDAEENTALVVSGIRKGADLHRLADLGVIPGEKVLLRRKLTNRAVVVRVKECDIALSPEIADTVIVEKPG